MFNLEFCIDVGVDVPVAIVPFDDKKGHPYHVFADTAQKVEESISYEIAVLRDAEGAAVCYIEPVKPMGEGWSVYRPSDWRREDSDSLPTREPYVIEPRDRRNFAVLLDAIFLLLWWQERVDLTN